MAFPTDAATSVRTGSRCTGVSLPMDGVDRSDTGRSPGYVTDGEATLGHLVAVVTREI
jgi:hypothetical protein